MSVFLYSVILNPTRESRIHDPVLVVITHSGIQIIDELIAVFWCFYPNFAACEAS